MEDIRKMVAENMKQVDQKLGVALVELLIDAYVKLPHVGERTKFIEEQIRSIINSMTTPLFHKD